MITLLLRSGAGVAARGVVVTMALGVLSAGATGCGLISSDVTNFDLTLPDKKLTIDTAGWQVTDKVSWYLMQSCASAPDACNSAVQMACTAGCSGACNAAKTCDLSL